MIILADKLMIIDGSSLLYRAFYALPLLSTKDGIYTNGVYGFLTMLYKILEDYEPEYICVAFDRKSPTFRHLEYEEYKANREEAPDELSLQFPIVKDILNKMNIYQVDIDGFEADDIAGTIAKMGNQNDLDVILVTGDKDYLQLINEKTKVLLTRKGITELEEYDEKKMFEEYGLNSKQFVDLKGLMGDKSDNIPGVPGVGEKTGIKLLKEFDSIENIYENIEDVRGKKTRESLLENQTQAFMSKKLAQIITNVPIEISIDDLKFKEPNYDALKGVYEKLQFNSFIEKFPDKVIRSWKDKVFEETDYKIVTLDNIDDILDEINKKKKIVFKFIYSGDNPLKDELLGIAFKVREGHSYYIDFLDGNIEVDCFMNKFKHIFEDESIEKLGHNIKEDIIILFRYNINISNIHFDSMIGQYIIDPSQNDYSINELSKTYLKIAVPKEEDILGKGKKKLSFKDISSEKREEYFCALVDVVYKLEEPIKAEIEIQNMSKLYYDVELPLIEVLANMEYTGFRVDLDILRDLGYGFDDQIQGLTKEIYKLAGKEFNINSPKQLGNVLFEDLKLPVIKKTKTGYSTNAEVLDKLKNQHPIVENVLKYRQIMKLKTTYIDGLLNLIDDETGRIHSSFNQTITTTGRISSTEPNLQNIPVKTEEGRNIRKAFVPKDGFVLVDGDYSQIELRVLAHISDDPKLKEAFYNDEDIHTRTASEVFHVPKDEVTPLMRSRAKAVNFGIVYGISDYGLSRDLDISRKEAKEYIENYLKNYRYVKDYMDDIVNLGKEKGYVETILHRRRYLPELHSKNYAIRSFGERIAMNTPIQGSAADIIKMAMVRVYKELEKRNMKSKLILQVHDELIIEAHKDELEEIKEIMKDIMENCVDLKVPLKVDIEVGDSWYDTK